MEKLIETLDKIRKNTNLDEPLNIWMFIREESIFKGFSKEGVMDGLAATREDINVAVFEDQCNGVMISSGNRFSFQFNHDVTVRDFLEICTKYDINPFVPPKKEE